MSVKSSIRDLNTINYIYIIVFLISNLNDLIKVSSRVMIYESNIKDDEISNKKVMKSEGYIKYNQILCL